MASTSYLTDREGSYGFLADLDPPIVDLQSNKINHIQFSACDISVKRMVIAVDARLDQPNDSIYHPHHQTWNSWPGPTIPQDTIENLVRCLVMELNMPVLTLCSAVFQLGQFAEFSPPSDVTIDIVTQNGFAGNRTLSLLEE